MQNTQGLVAGFNHRSDHVGFVVDKVGLGQVSYDSISRSSNCFMFINHPIIDAIQSRYGYRREISN
jgi:hypothetical protein